jgi:23S rRNA pseudouridine2605 synthase
MAKPRSSTSRSRPRRKDGSSASGRRRAGGEQRAKPDEKPGKKGPKRGKKSPKKAREQPFTPNEREQREGVRLQKYIASAGVTSRRKAEELIVAGLVEVNGRTVTELGTRVFPGRDRVAVRGEPIVAEAKVYYLLNKPDEVVCSAEGSVDERGRPTVLSLMHGVGERLFPVGRLDYHSRGVLILTNDGELAAAVTHPRHGVVKTYHVKFQGKLSPEEEQALRDGVELDDGAVTRPLVELFPFRETETNVWYQIGLAEGLNRQLRRMGEAIGHPVLKLIRVAIGDITADGLAEGEFRPLTMTEVGQLLASVKLTPERGARKPKPAKTKSKPRPGAKPRRASPGKTPKSGAKPAGKSPGTSRGKAKAARSEGGGSKSRPGQKPKASGGRSGSKPRAGTKPTRAKRGPAGAPKGRSPKK